MSRELKIAEKVASRVWNFNQFVETMEQKLVILNKVNGQANKEFADLVRAAEGEGVDLDNDREVTALSMKCNVAKEHLRVLKNSLSQVEAAVENYHDELLFRAHHSGVGTRI